MGYKHNMKDEKEPKRRRLLSEGWRLFTILDCREDISKSGNDMFIFTIKDIKTDYEEDVYAVAVKGKRWFLKSILTAVGCSAGEDGIYDWDIPQVINKEFMGLVEHEPNEYINRDNETVKTTQHRIVRIKQTSTEEAIVNEENEPPWEEQNESD